MKIRLEQAPLGELEVCIRGELNSQEARLLVAAIQGLGGAGRLMLHKGEREYPTDPAAIAYFAAEGSRVYAYVEGQAYEARQKLYALATLLRGRGFIQISKGVVANAHHIASVAAEFSGNYTTFLKDGKTQLTISRKYMKDFRNFIMEVL